MYVTFKKQGGARTGNCIFQYLTCKLFCLLQGHVYVPLESFKETDYLVLNDTDYIAALNNPESARRHIYCDGFFQQSAPLIKHRAALLDSIHGCDDYWFEGSRRRTIAEFLTTPTPVTIGPRDILLSLRLDDFIQLPCPTSDIIPPLFYTNLLETLFFERLYIVCDKLHHDWERKYLEFFAKWSPTLIQGDLLTDAAAMREAPHLIHSNSTLCWIMSYFSRTHKTRVIPRTYFYKGQSLDAIDADDRVLRVTPLRHAEVYALNVGSLAIHNYLPLPYAIPDKYIVPEFPTKTRINTGLTVGAVGDRSAHRFGAGQETEYLETYHPAVFAKTGKRGGWDCLRHYEILAGGAIPEFDALASLPSKTMVSFPKKLLGSMLETLNSGITDAATCEAWGAQLLAYTQASLGTRSLAAYFLSKFRHPIHNVLLLTGHPGPNYSREFLTIGLAATVPNLVCFPPLPYMYKDAVVDKSRLHGNGFCYTSHLEPQTIPYDESTIRELIAGRFWDLIIFGKIGPDEGHGGCARNNSLWGTISAAYGPDKIAFIYGGDEQTRLSANNRYTAHLAEHSKLGKCFVRELSD